MPLRSLLARWQQRPRTTHHLGLAFSPGRWTVAVVRLGLQGRPVLVAHESFTDDGNLLALRKWLRKRKLRITTANLMLPGGDYQVVAIETPQVPKVERAEAARWTVKNMIDFPVEEASIACVVAPSPDGQSEGNQAWAIVARRERVVDWLQRAQRASVQLQSVDVPELGLRNILALEPTPNACALLRVSSSGGALIVVWKGELCSFRRFDDLTTGSFATADLMTRQALVERLGLELQRTADAFERQFHGTAIERVWVQQSVPEVDLVQQLAPHVSLRVQAFDPIDRLEIGEDVVNHHGGNLDLVAVGAALRQAVTTAEAAV